MTHTDQSPSRSSVHGILQGRILECYLCPPPGDLPDPGTEPISPGSTALAGRFFTTNTTWDVFNFGVDSVRYCLEKKLKNCLFN